VSALVFRRRLIYLTAGVILGVMVALGVTALMPRLYSSSIFLSVSPQSSSDAISAYQGSLLSEAKARSYSQLLTSNGLAQDVVERLSLPMSATELASRLSVSVQTDTNLLAITATADTPQGATDIANTVDASFSDMISDLERQTDPTTFHSATVTSVAPATTVVTQVSPNPFLNAWLGGIVGLLLSFVAFWVREKMDTTVRSSEQLGVLLDSPNLGVVSLGVDDSTNPFSIIRNRLSASAESFRYLRSIFTTLEPEARCRAIMVASANPGEGRTSVACNLAAAIASSESPVLLLECDLRRPRVAETLGDSDRVGLADVLTDGRLLSTAIRPVADGLDVMVAGRQETSDPARLLGSRSMALLMSELRRSYDFIIVDTPALLPLSDATSMAPFVDGAVLVCRYGKTRRDQIRDAGDRLRIVSIPLMGGVLTMHPSRASSADGYYSSPRPATEAPRGPLGGSVADEGKETDAAPSPQAHPRISTGADS
jgi:capsular exopolysaccharide synthesis family protein